MSRRLRSVWRELTGRSNSEFVAALIAQLEACLEGARIAHQLSTGELGPADARKQMEDAEHKGDRKRAILVEQLGRSIVTPIDREDLFRVSRSIDDVLDNLRDYVREVDLMEAVTESKQLTDLTEAVTNTIELLMTATSHLVETRHEVAEMVLAAKKSGGTIRQMYQRAIAELLDENQPDNGESIRALMSRRELLRRLDVVGLRLGEAADALADGIIKRSY